MAKNQHREVINNQVFIGCPWLRVRAKYETAIDELRKKFPLSFIIVGRDDDQDAEELLEIITKKLSSSSRAIFDATNGNANVSLEYGFAEAKGIDRSIYMSSHRASKKASGDKPIISDLAGKRQNHYKQQKGLNSLLSTMAKNHDYTKRFEKALKKSLKRRTSGEKKSARALALKIIHVCDGTGTVRRDDLVQNLLADPSSYKRDAIEKMIRALHAADLVQSVQGPHSTVSIT